MKSRILSGIILAASMMARAAITIDQSNKCAWSGNLGWTVWRAGAEGACMNDHVCSGFVWSANCGWIQLGNGQPLDGIRYSNTSAGDYGVNLVNAGFVGGQPVIRLRGFAYGANIGWIHFEDQGDPRISLRDGGLSGLAWSANCGWIGLGDSHWFVRTSIAPGPDIDADGIADAWERELAPAGSLDVLTNHGDADGDGVSDVSEIVAGTKPFDASSRFGITGFEAGSVITITWTSSPLCEYRLFSTATLRREDWSLELDHIVPSGETTTVRVPETGLPAKFFRVESVRALPE